MVVDLLKTVAGAVDTTVRAAGVAATLGLHEGAKRGLEDAANSTAKHAKKTAVFQAADTIVAAVPAVGLAVASAATLGLNDDVNQAAKRALTDVGQKAAEVGHRVIEGYDELYSPAMALNRLTQNYNFTTDLPSHATVKWLCRCARDAYHPERGGEQKEWNCNLVNLNHMTAYFYTDAANQRQCLAIRGTVPDMTTSTTLPQDLTMWLGIAAMNVVIDKAVSWANELRNRNTAWDTYVCGHSLGGFLAEAVSSRTGLPGASFNGPGARGNAAGFFKDNFTTATQFEVHLNTHDPFCRIGKEYHIAKPQMHSHGPRYHSIEAMYDEL